MAKIKLVTDSTADIPPEVRAELGIEMVPLKVHFGHETYRDGVDLTPQQFFEKLAASSALPTTSQPSPAEFAELYGRLSQDEETEIISVHLSSLLSGTFQTAQMSKSLLERHEHITVVDSRSASYGIGMLVVAAAKAAQEGKSKEECLRLIEDMRKQMSIYFLVDTLEYLQKGGRIGKAAALVGSLLNIKPILSINSAGEVYSADKVRGQKKAMARIIELIQSDVAGRPIHLTVAHANNLEHAQQFYEVLRGHLDIQHMQYTSIGPVIGTHAGPSAVAAFVVPAV
ncbi:DegV family protein [Paenibacillus thalictri]|uniref:DegV family protein n=1 Tax=Paenibacillus thalictri TaxID=2527873 RepID=A0A4Q9DPU7_9BACL|nr:DegV family protein [Paenibacillus thalictri]TBL78345.1 DegV family protein [Paenibacillus thalictri]